MLCKDVTQVTCSGGSCKKKKVSHSWVCEKYFSSNHQCECNYFFWRFFFPLIIFFKLTNCNTANLMVIYFFYATAFKTHPSRNKSAFLSICDFDTTRLRNQGSVISYPSPLRPPEPRMITGRVLSRSRSGWPFRISASDGFLLARRSGRSDRVARASSIFLTICSARNREEWELSFRRVYPEIWSPFLLQWPASVSVHLLSNQSPTQLSLGRTKIMVTAMVMIMLMVIVILYWTLKGKLHLNSLDKINKKTPHQILTLFHLLLFITGPAHAKPFHTQLRA